MLVQCNWVSVCEIKVVLEILNQLIKVFLIGRVGIKLVYNKFLYVLIYCYLIFLIILLLFDGYFQLLKKVSYVCDNDYIYVIVLVYELKNL